MLRSFFLLSAFLLCTAANSQDLPDSVFSALSAQVRQSSDGFERLSRFCRETGHRLTGSANGQKAEEWMLRTFREKGLERTEFFPFPIRTWKRSSCRLEIVPHNSDNFVPIKAVSLANTPSASGMWNIVDGGDGLDADLRPLAAKIKGNCLLINLDLVRKDSGRQNLHRAEKVSLALRYGAASVLFVHPKEGDMVLTGTASLDGIPVEIPALCISGREGREVRQWMKEQALMAAMEVNNEISEGKARNVIAVLEAPVPTNETILVCGHLDSWDLGTGAVDNGIGSFTIPDIAGALRQQQKYLKRNVVFLLTMGEEQGLLGSRALAAQWLKEGKLKDLKAVVNLDMTGNPLSVNDFDWPEAEGFFIGSDKLIARNYAGFTGKRSHSPGLHSDHQPFMLEGIPSFSMNSSMPDSVYACYHADCDNIQLVKDFYMGNSALAHSLLIMDLASRRDLGFKRMKPKKLVKWLKTHRLKEKLEISGEWKWN
jgi:Iap family predicted aminopeptidase